MCVVTDCLHWKKHTANVYILCKYYVVRTVSTKQGKLHTIQSERASERAKSKHQSITACMHAYIWENAADCDEAGLTAGLVYDY